ncbi:hypothetical protein AAFF_G00125750 [Aldrovandia affinis]|uniref:Ig-like domain-containing protein n=1 Tax=Aldrovandia affinis TaxID=143900 RepID=A0AAD7RR31_9TELE|nr:hypothetical protein AAFF_G00125750 [Aldrovandia affinis]
MTVDPQKEFHISGSDLTLFCSAQSCPPAEFKWAFNAMTLNREGQEFKLEDIQGNQSGYYTCWAHNTRTLRYKPSDPSLITVIEKISDANITGPTERLIAGNSSANLSCQATAGTIVSREWLKDDQTLSPSNRITLSGDKSSVSIDPVEGTDNGQYQCILTNPVSRGIASYNLTVIYGPENVVIDGDFEVDVGDTVVLICSASSVPPPAFTWSFNRTESSVTTAEYTVGNAMDGDSGNYICVAENTLTGLNNSSAVHVLTVRSTVGFNPGPPLGAILGGVFGALACVGLVAAVVILVMKNKKSSSGTRSSDRSTSNQQPNVGKPELAYADISHFRKADGGKVQLGGSATVHAQPMPGQTATGHQETLYADIRKK